MKIYNITDPMQYLSIQTDKDLKALWLDDERDPARYFYPKTLDRMEIDWAHDYKEFDELIQDGKYTQYDMICLDHDLGGESDAPTGYDCVMDLDEEHYEWGLPCPDVFVHTGNPVGKKRMLMVLDKIMAREIQKRM